ncbi:hypothetical protein GGF32_000932 [Allomyces javanicus]|nr:hypothetical protein GGF32_000932 [Allomyces javanicus]
MTFTGTETPPIMDLPVDSLAAVERFNTYSLLITWRGPEDGGAHVDLDAWRDPAHGATLLMAVVPVPAGTEAKWKHPPFAGHIDEEGFVWDRGVVDCKGNLVILFEGVERLLAAGYWPSRTIYIASGHDEEIGGFIGSAQIAARLRKRGVESLAMAGGSSHAGMSSTNDPVVVLGRAITAIEERERRTIFGAGVQLMAPDLVPCLSPMQRSLISSNPLLFRKAVAKVLQTMSAKRTRLAAMMQTTIAFTMLEGSPKINVIPDTASAFMDQRVVAGETVDSILADLREFIARVSPQLTIDQWGKTTADPSPISTTAKTDPYYSTLTRFLHGMYRAHRTAQEPAFGRVVVAPTVLSATTDMRRCVTLARRIYRTSLFLVWTREQMAGLHGANERLQAENIARGVSGTMELMSAVGEMPESDPVAVPAPMKQHNRVAVNWDALDHKLGEIEDVEDLPANFESHANKGVDANGFGSLVPDSNNLQIDAPSAANLRRSQRLLSAAASSSSSSLARSSPAQLVPPQPHSTLQPPRRGSAASSRPRSPLSNLPLQRGIRRKTGKRGAVAFTDDQDDGVGHGVPPPPRPGKRQRRHGSSASSSRSLTPPLPPSPHHFPAGASATAPAQPAQPFPPSHPPPALSPTLSPTLSPAPQAGPASSSQRTPFPTRPPFFPTGSVSHPPPPQDPHAPPPAVLVEARQPAPTHQDARAVAPPPGLVPAQLVRAPPTPPAVAVPDPAPIDAVAAADPAPINAVAAADPALMAAAAAADLNPRRVDEIVDAMARLGASMEELTNLLQEFGPMMEDIQRMLRQQEQQQQQQEQEQRRGGGGGGGGGWYAGVLCIAGVLLWMGM